MKLSFVYADFNSLNRSTIERYDSVLHLTGYGTLASLSWQKIRLTEGARIIFFEPNDIEVEGIAHFDRAMIDPAGRKGAWVALINEKEIRDSHHDHQTRGRHLCFSCDVDLNEVLPKGRNYSELCPKCHTSVMAPLAPPADAT